MKVKLRTMMAGPQGCFQPGDVVELPNEAAEALILSGQAERVKESFVQKLFKKSEQPIETATKEPVKEDAVLGRRRAKKMQ